MSNKNWREMPRMSQVVIFVVGVMDELIEHGFVMGGKYHLTDSSRIMVSEMKQDIDLGLWESPTQEEIHVVLSSINSEDNETEYTGTL